MSKRIKVADLPGFDAAHYLDSETSIAAYLTSILEANDEALLASREPRLRRAWRVIGGAAHPSCL